MLGWRHAFGDNTPTDSAQAFAGRLIFTVERGRWKYVAVLEAGVETLLRPKLTLVVPTRASLARGSNRTF